MIPLVLMAVGTALQVAGGYKANLDQAEAELRNEAFYKKQATLSTAAAFREMHIAGVRYTATKGAQLSAYAKGGVDISGSAAEVIASTLADKVDEIESIRLKGTMDYTLAMSRARLSGSTAASLRDPVNNLLQAGGTVMGAAAKGSDSGSSPAMKSFTPVASTGYPGNSLLTNAPASSYRSGYLGSGNYTY